MYKIRRILNSSDTYQVLSLKYAYWNLKTILITFLLLLTGISIQSADAADSIVSENHETQLRVSGLNSQPDISFRQRFLVASPIIKNDLHLTDETNVLQQKQSQIIVQTDPSETLGDTFAETNKLRQELLIDPIMIQGERSKASPGSTAGTPSAYGAGFGQAYIGGGLLFPLDENKDRVDGSLSLGFGLGDAAKSVGLEVNVNITSVGGGGDSFDFGDSGGVGFKLHKYLGDGTAVAIGWSNPIKWGDVTKAKETIYGVVSRSFPLQPDNLNNKLPLTVSVGLGSGAFRSKGAIATDENNVNLFASLGLRVIPQVSLVSSWTGNRLNMGTSFVPFKKTPLVMNAIFTDVTSNLSTGLGFAVIAGYVFEFLTAELSGNFINHKNNEIKAMKKQQLSFSLSLTLALIFTYLVGMPTRVNAGTANITGASEDSTSSSGDSFNPTLQSPVQPEPGVNVEFTPNSGLSISTEVQNSLNKTATNIFSQSPSANSPFAIIVAILRGGLNAKPAANQLQTSMVSLGVSSSSIRSLVNALLGLAGKKSASVLGVPVGQLQPVQLVANTKGLMANLVIAQQGETPNVDIQKLNDAINVYNNIVMQSSPEVLQKLAKDPEFLELSNLLKQFRVALNKS